MNLLFMCHFLINAVDKTVTSHLMQRQQVSFHRKLLSNYLTFSLNAIISTWVSRRNFVLARQTHSSSLKCFHLMNKQWSQRSEFLGPRVPTINFNALLIFKYYFLTSILQIFFWFKNHSSSFMRCKSVSLVLIFSFY